jgi:CRISPR-associated RAMP protein (TIGR02581 family)
LQTALRISSGRADDRTDAPLIRTLDGVPYIPGTSLRGALRSAVERLLSGVGKDVSQLCSCTLFTDSHCGDFIVQEVNNRNVSGPERDKLLQELAQEHLCDVCRLFGCAVYASRLVIADALPDAPRISQLQGRARLRDGVGIDRDTGAARENVKFDYEVLESRGDCPTFGFEMTAENLDETDTRLVNLILKILKGGLYVGGKRAGGLGLLRLQEQTKTKNGQEKKFHYQVKCLTDLSSWWQALTAGQDLTKGLYRECPDWKEIL